MLCKTLPRVWLEAMSGVYWHPLRGLSAETIFFAMAIGCVANWIRNRTLHCSITAPVFLIAGAISLLTDMHLIQISSALICDLTLVAVGIAFLVERRYAGHPRP